MLESRVECRVEETNENQSNEVVELSSIHIILYINIFQIRDLSSGGS